MFKQFEQIFEGSSSVSIKKKGAKERDFGKIETNHIELSIIENDVEDNARIGTTLQLSSFLHYEGEENYGSFIANYMSIHMNREDLEDIHAFIGYLLSKQ